MDTDGRNERHHDRQYWLNLADAWVSSADNSMVAEVFAYAESRTNCDIPPMMYLYNTSELEVLYEMVPRIVAAVMLQEFEKIDREDPAQLAAIHDEERLMHVLACYTKFIVLVNPRFDERAFYGLMLRFWMKYDVNVEREMCIFWDEAENWRDGMRGCLLFHA